MLNSHIDLFEKSMGHVPSDVEAAKLLATVLPPGYYTAADLQAKYDELKAVVKKTPEQQSTFFALGKVLNDHDTFYKVDGIRTNGVTDGTISTWGLALEGNTI